MQVMQVWVAGQANVVILVFRWKKNSELEGGLVWRTTLPMDNWDLNNLSKLPIPSPLLSPLRPSVTFIQSVTSHLFSIKTFPIFSEYQYRSQKSWFIQCSHHPDSDCHITCSPLPLRLTPSTFTPNETFVPSGSGTKSVMVKALLLLFLDFQKMVVKLFLFENCKTID